MIVSLLAEIVVVVFALFLIGLAAVVVTKPAIAARFFASFASSARAHYTEQIIRLIIGASLVVLSPAMWSADLFRIVGWMVVVTSVALMVLPWRWHQKFAQWAIPRLIRRMRLYAAGLLVFGVLLLAGLFFGSSHVFQGSQSLYRADARSDGC